jgi:hypothetical protein
MEIKIKQIKPFTIELVDDNNDPISKSKVHIYFDVITDDKVFIDDNNIGYFPIEFDEMDEKDLIKACESWIESNDILSKYTGENIEDYQLKINNKNDIINRIEILESKLNNVIEQIKIIEK